MKNKNENIDNKYKIKTITSITICCLLLLVSIIFYNKASILAVININFYIILLLFFVFFLILNIYFKFNITKKIFDNILYAINTISVFGFIILFIFSTAKVSGDSMNDTYYDNDTILVWSLFYEPKTDDVIVINTDNYGLIIKRVIATSNDKLTYENNALYVNDVLIQNMEYSVYLTLSNIKQGEYLVLGDNRNNSLDSRHIGLIDENDIIGKSIFRLFPNIGFPK